MLLLAVMAGAGVGAASRWLADQWVQARHDSLFPWGTWLINVTGSLILGVVLAGYSAGDVSEGGLALLGVGFSGGFTTFSTFGYEAVRLVEDGSGRLAFGYVASSVIVGLAAAIAGWYLGGAVFG